MWHRDGLWWPWNTSAQIFVQEHQLQGVILTDGLPGCSHLECWNHLASGWFHPMPESGSDNGSGPLPLIWDILMGTISSGTPITLEDFLRPLSWAGSSSYPIFLPFPFTDIWASLWSDGSPHLLWCLTFIIYNFPKKSLAYVILSWHLHLHRLNWP